MSPPAGAAARSAGRTRLALAVTVVAVTVGGIVAVVGGWGGTGACSGSVADPTLGASPPDALCFSLVRTLAVRMGLVAAVATAIVVLMSVGLSRTAAGPTGGEGGR